MSGNRYSKQLFLFCMKTSTLSPQLLKELTEKLLEEKNKFLKELNLLDGETGDVSHPEYGSDDEENAAEVAEYETNLSIEHGLKKSLRDVQSALKRIDDGSYGLCKYCEKPIPEERLKARPTSSSCITCKKAITQEA